MEGGQLTPKLTQYKLYIPLHHRQHFPVSGGLLPLKNASSSPLFLSFICLPFAGGSGPFDLGPAPLRLDTCAMSWTRGLLCLLTQKFCGSASLVSPPCGDPRSLEWFENSASPKGQKLVTGKYMVVEFTHTNAGVSWISNQTILMMLDFTSHHPKSSVIR